MVWDLKPKFAISMIKWFEISNHFLRFGLQMVEDLKPKFEISVINCLRSQSLIGFEMLMTPILGLCLFWRPGLGTVQTERVAGGGGVGDAGEEPDFYAVRPPSSRVVCELLHRSAIARHHEQGKAHEDGQRCPHWRKGQRQKVHLESNFVFVFACFHPSPSTAVFLVYIV